MNLGMLNRHSAAAYRWLRPRIGADGAWLDEPAAIVDAYYKVPWWLTSTGDQEAAAANLQYIEQSFLQPDGDVQPVTSEKLIRRYPLIPHAHIAIGAVQAGRSDLAAQLLDFLGRHQHPQLGGWGARSGASGPDMVDVISSACIALAFLEAGRPESAEQAAAFLERVLNLQPSPDTDFYTTLDSSGSLLTQFDDEAVLVDRRVSFSTKFQVWHAIGFPIMLLARLHELGGDRRWLHLAEHFVRMYSKSPQAWVDLAAGKAAWGFAVLYRTTGDATYRHRARRALRGLVSWQDADGGWLSCLAGAGGTSESVTSIGYEICTELAMWLGAVGRIVADGDGSDWSQPSDPMRLEGVERAMTWMSRRAARERRLAPVRLRRLQRRAAVLGRPQS